MALGGGEVGKDNSEGRVTREKTVAMVQGRDDGGRGDGESGWI